MNDSVGRPGCASFNARLLVDRLKAVARTASKVHSSELACSVGPNIGRFIRQITAQKQNETDY